jgi:nitroreductase
MKAFLKNEELIDALNARYAVKQFEKRDIDTSELEDIVKSILQLTPASFGLQAYKFINVKDKSTREALREYSWAQSQVTDADILLVFTVPINFDKSYIEKHMKNMQKIKKMNDEKKDERIKFMVNKIIETGEEIWITNFEEWITKQVYIALWNLITALSILGIDSCPLEGLNPKEYNRILKLDEKNLTTKVAIAIWKRHADDKYQNEKKVRFSKKELFIEV